jgi:cytoskeletal protein CcmA (bactofilin family)
MPIQAAEEGSAAARTDAQAIPMHVAAASGGRDAMQPDRDAFPADPESPPRNDRVIAHGVRVFGTVEYESGAGLRIDGVVIGNVIARNLDADRCVTIGVGAMIVGDVWAHRVRVDGVIEGTLTAEECEITGQVSGGVQSVTPPRLQGATARVHGAVEALTQVEFPERHQMIQRAAQARSERLVNQIGAMEALQTLSNVRGVERDPALRVANPTPPSEARPRGRLQVQIREIERSVVATATSAPRRANVGSQRAPMKPE